MFGELKLSQLFDAFMADRLEHAAKGYPPHGVFEREVAELLGNIEMFGDLAPGPFRSALRACVYWLSCVC
jgi:hypothetical protein